MANALKMAQVNTIRTLLEQGWSQRRVAATLGINRAACQDIMNFSDGTPSPSRFRACRRLDSGGAARTEVRPRRLGGDGGVPSKKCRMS